MMPACVNDLHHYVQSIITHGERLVLLVLKEFLL